MYIVSRMESGKCFGEVLETGWYTEGDTFFEVEEELSKHDAQDIIEELNK